VSQFGRRQFLSALGATALTVPFARKARGAPKVPQVGILVDGVRKTPSGRNIWEKFTNGSFGRAGYSLGKDIRLEWRYTEQNPRRLPELVDDLIRRKVDVILSLQSWPAVHHLRVATATIPIVMHGYPVNPVGMGLIKSFARPGGNVTGTTWVRDLGELFAKQYQLLREAVPGASRVAYIRWSKSDAMFVAGVIARAKEAFGFDLTDFPVSGPSELGPVLDRVSTLRPDALFVVMSGFMITSAEIVADFAIRHKLIAIGTTTAFAVGGGLLYYGPEESHLIDRTISYVDRILRGAKPGDLPVEEPTKYEFVFNAKTARAIGYSLPTALQLRVDRVIE